MRKFASVKLGARPAETRAGQPRLYSTQMMSRIAPPRLIRAHIDPAPIMADNSQIGDCTSAGLANAIRATSALNGFQTDITDGEAVRFYSASTGYIPGNPATDQGGVEVDVLAYAARNGYALANQTLYPLWGSIEAQDFNALRLVMAGLGTAYLGVQLARADQAHVGAVWDTETATADGDPTPGSWGGHCLLGWAYTGTSDNDLVTLLTWGTTQRATWRWLRSRIMEVHATLWPQLASPVSGFLTMDDLASVRAQNAAFLNGATAA